MPVKCEIVNETRIGQRPYNEDRLGYWLTEESLLLAVADGLGGHAHGALAAELAIGSLMDSFRQAAQPRLADPDLFLFRAIGKAHALLCSHAREHGLAETPRTTVVACVVQDARAYWSHVGDSRLYLLREGEVAARTTDQTLVQELVDMGRLSQREAASHPQRNVLLQCLGGPLPPRVAPASSAQLRRGDVLVLCSDGFHGPLASPEIGRGLSVPDLQAALAALAGVAEARAGAQCDNLTVIAMAWLEEHAQLTSTPAAEGYMSDEQIAREIERIRRAFLAQSAPPPAEECVEAYMSDEQIGREIERIRQAFVRGKRPFLANFAPDAASQEPHNS
jgi:serine/threonine protein phosphatase PrpC